MTDHPLRSSAGAVGLARPYVTSHSVYQLETERVFQRNWICFGRESELSGSECLVREIEGNHLLVIRGDDNRVRAFRNFCRHRGSRLVSRENCSTVGERLQCPYHAWTYDRNGDLVSAPNMKDVDGFSKSDFGLLQVECETWHGFIWIRFSPGKTSLKEFLSPLESHAESWCLTELEIGSTIQYDVAANWKLIFQNYSECYHCPTVHPALNRLTPYKGSANDLEEGPVLGGPMHLADGCESMSTTGKRVADVLPGLDEHQKRCIAYYTLFPSLFVSFHPDYVLLHRLERKSVAHTNVTCHFLFHPESQSRPDFDAGPAVEFWDQTNRQDWEVCELAQAGMGEPGFIPGPYSNLESVVAAFDQHYLSEMED